MSSPSRRDCDPPSCRHVSRTRRWRHVLAHADESRDTRADEPCRVGVGLWLGIHVLDLSHHGGASAIWRMTSHAPQISESDRIDRERRDAFACKAADDTGDGGYQLPAGTGRELEGREPSGLVPMANRTSGLWREQLSHGKRTTVQWLFRG